MKSSVIILSILIISGCTTTPVVKHDVIVGPGTFYAKWQKKVLEKCSQQATIITIDLVARKTREGYVFAEGDVINIYEYIVKKCSVDGGIVI